MAKSLSDRLLALLPEDGSSRGNISLRNELHCTEEEYTETKLDLLNKDEIRTGAGRGGSIWLSGKRVAQNTAEAIFKYLKNNNNDGSYIGNMALRNALGLDDEIYWSARDILIAEGKITRGTGKGGSVALLENDETKIIHGKLKKCTDKNCTYKKCVLEKVLMSPLEQTLNSDWSNQYQYGENYHIFDTSNQGKAKTGVWSRPDFVACVYKEYEFCQNTLEIISFEVKPYNGIDIKAVYECLSHRKFSNYSYLLLHTPEEEQPVNVDIYNTIYSLCIKYGIGLILFSNPLDFNSWEIILDSVHACPPPDEIENFFTLHSLDIKGKKKVRSWLR